MRALAEVAVPILPDFLMNGTLNEAIATNGIVDTLSPIPPGSNPYHFDLYHQGVEINKDIHIMFSSTHKYIIAINPNTGNRVRIDLSDL